MQRNGSSLQTQLTQNVQLETGTERILALEAVSLEGRGGEERNFGAFCDALVSVE